MRTSSMTRSDSYSHLIGNQVFHDCSSMWKKDQSPYNEEGRPTMPEADSKNADNRCGGKERRKNVADRGQHDTANVDDPGFGERRSRIEHRQDVLDRRLGLDRRRGPGRRRSDDRKAAEEGQMSDEQFQFIMAIDEYKRANSRPFPTWTEVLEIIKALGYRKIADPQPLAESQSDPDA